MAATQAAAEKAAAEARAAEQQAAQAAEAEAAAAKAAAEKEATEKAAAAQKAAAKPAQPKAPALEVLGPVAVLPLVGGGERYVYRGAPIGDEFTKEGVKHAVAVGLVGKPKK